MLGITRRIFKLLWRERSKKRKHVEVSIALTTWSSYRKSALSTKSRSGKLVSASITCSDSSMTMAVKVFTTLQRA